MILIDQEMSEGGLVMEPHVKEEQRPLVLEILITNLVTSLTLNKLQDLGLLEQSLVIKLGHAGWQWLATLDAYFAHWTI